MDEVPVELRTVMIRNFDRALWARLRAEAAARRWDSAAMVEHIVRAWFAQRSDRSGPTVLAS